MGFWLEVLEEVAASIGAAKSSDVKIQIRQPSDGFWRDFSFVSRNTESVQNGIQLAASSYPAADVRAIDKHGEMVDFS